MKDFLPMLDSFMFRKLIALFLGMLLCWTTLAVGESTAAIVPESNLIAAASATKLPDGRYPVQQASYNDGDGGYSLFVLNAPQSVFVTIDLQMARLTEAEISSGQTSYLEIASGQPVLHLSEDFKIEYIHAVTETQTNPQTNQPQTVIVRRESSFWTPFAGALAGQMVANMLFTPHYYLPPVYQPGIVLSGYGGYGNTYSQAVQQYETRYQSPPAAVKNTSQFRTTGRIRSNNTTTGKSSTPAVSNNRPTGSGFGASNLKRSENSSPSRLQRGSGSFGSGRSPAARSGFGSRRSFAGRRR
jgi:hypothetical protein